MVMVVSGEWCVYVEHPVCDIVISKTSTRHKTAYTGSLFIHTYVETDRQAVCICVKDRQTHYSDMWAVRVEVRAHTHTHE